MYTAESESIKGTIDSSAALDGIPKLSFKYSELEVLEPRKRALKIAKAFAEANVSAFAKGVAISRLVDYGFDALAPNNGVSQFIKNTIHTLIHLYEADSVFQSVVSIEPEASENEHDFGRSTLNLLREQIGLRFFNTQVGDMGSSHCSDDHNEDASIADIIEALDSLNPKIAKQYGVEIQYRERIESDSLRTNYLFVVSIAGRLYGVYATVHTITSSAYRPNNDLNLILPMSRMAEGNTTHEFMESMTTISRANFVISVEPEKHIVELDEYRTRVTNRRASVEKMPNLNLDEIQRSIKSALDKQKRRVIALVGDAGLGKTVAMHSIINRFLDVPAFIVTPTSLGQYPSGTNVRSIFESVHQIKSILVFDDFEGFGLAEKNDITTEFLRQLDGSSGFNGVAILIVNDPSKLHHTLINRPGRVDEVYEIQYLSKFDDIKTVLQSKFQNVKFDNSYMSVFKYMSDNSFSTARMVHAVEYMTEQFKMSPSNLLKAAKRMLDFEGTATKSCIKGRLVEVDDSVPASKSNSIVKRKRHIMSDLVD